MATRRKILVIALDGATWDLLTPWMEVGKLPCLKRLCDEGATAALQSTIPPITPVAWSTFMTSKNSGHTGIFDFFRPLRSQYTDLVPVVSPPRRNPTLWGILSQRGYRVGVINMPMTYPAEPVNGFLISGVPALAQPDIAYPTEILAELQAHGWDLTRNAAVVESSYKRYLEYLSELVATRLEATKYLLAAKEWDAFFIHFLETDQVQHTYWRFLGDKTADGAPHPLSHAMLQIFQQVDRGIADLVEMCGIDTDLVILSDHGMGPTSGHVYLNNWLLQEGFIKWRSSVATTLRRWGYAIGLNPAALYRLMPSSLLRRFTLGDLRAGLAGISTEHVGRKQSRLRLFANRLLRLPLLSFADVDWSRTIAYATGPTQTGFIYINLKGREPQGIITPGEEYKQIRNAIRRRLSQMKNPITGDLMVDQVYFGEELYSGSYMPEAPDIIVTYRDGKFDSKHGSIFWSTSLVEPVKNANAAHRALGILLMWSPVGSIAHCHISTAHLRDLAPTLLYLMDEAIPGDMEGHVLLDGFTDAYQSDNKPRQQDALAPAPSTPPRDESGLDPEEQEIILGHLRDLGYLD